jgi:hypothetical protein
VVTTRSAEMIAGHQGWLGATAWFASRNEVCVTAGGEPVCFPGEEVSGLAAGPEGAWVATDGELRAVTASGGWGPPLPHEKGAWFQDLTYDPARGVVWVWGGDTHLHAIDPKAGRYRVYPHTGTLGAAVVGDALVRIGIPGMPQVARLR